MLKKLRNHINRWNKWRKYNCNSRLHIFFKNKSTGEVEEWVWVNGLKGTEADMKCRDYQYELGKRFDIPDDEEVSECRSGFHLCMKMENVLRYYSIGSNHRFFEVKALVRRTDFDTYFEYGRDKLVARSIEFVRELTVDEIFEYANIKGCENWSDEDKRTAIEYGFQHEIPRLDRSHTQSDFRTCYQ